MRPIRESWAALVLTGIVAAGCSGGLAQRAPTGRLEPLPADPALVRGTLANGLSYIVRRHGNPAGRVSVWLHVATGSLNETDDTRGLAHFLEHVAHRGSASFPPGSVFPLFQSLGLSPGRDQNAFTSFDQTVYTLALPDTRPETLDRALLFLSDVAFRLSLLPGEIDAERSVVLEEKRSRAAARQRIRDAINERLAPESTLGRRLPIGTEPTLGAMSAAQFREYYRRWYVASNMTVIAVGDLAPDDVVAEITRHFAHAPRLPRPEPRPVGIRPTVAMRAIVVTDPELTQADVAFMRAELPRPPVTTEADYRRRLIDELGIAMVNQRINALLADGQVAFLSGDAWNDEWATGIRMLTLRAATAPERWRATLTDLAAIVTSVRTYGFAAHELEEARRTVLAAAEQWAQQEPTVPARTILRRINASVSRREPPLSAAQHLALRTRLASDLSPGEVSEAFARDFDPARTIVVLALPAGAAAPTEDQLVALGRTAFAATARKLADAPPLASPAAPGATGTVVEERHHDGTAVTSVWLENGVRVHHRFVAQRQNEASVRITLAGGVIEERAGDRGVTEAAVRSWDNPASRTLSSRQIRTFLTGKRVQLRATIGDDTVTLTVSGDPAALAEGLGVARLLLTEPAVEAASFEQWRERKLQEIADRAIHPRGVMSEAVAEAFYPALEARLRPVTTLHIRSLAADATQAWLTRFVARAPIEVAIVGDLPRARAIELAAQYLGSVPGRPRISRTTLEPLRAVAAPAGPVRVARAVTSQTDQAQVMAGFFGADMRRVRDGRLLATAARVLSTRMHRVLREERQLVYSIRAQSRPGEAYPAFGAFLAEAPTDPGKAEALAEAIDAMVTSFATDGPTADELIVARQQLLNTVSEAIAGPEFWVSRLATLDYRGIPLDDIATLAADYAQFTANEVRETFARYAHPAARFRFVVTPDRRR